MHNRDTTWFVLLNYLNRGWSLHRVQVKVSPVVFEGAEAPLTVGHLCHKRRGVTCALLKPVVTGAEASHQVCGLKGLLRDRVNAIPN